MRDSPLRRQRQQNSPQFAVRPRKEIRTDLQGQERRLAVYPVRETDVNGPPDSLLAGSPVYEPAPLAAREGTSNGSDSVRCLAAGGEPVDLEQVSALRGAD